MKCQAVVLAVVAARCAAGVGRRAAEIIEQILVKVNGDIFTKTDLETAPGRGAAQQGSRST